MASRPDEPPRWLGRELRERGEGAFRADAEEREQLAAQAARRRRTLADVAQELLSRGDRVRVQVPGRSFTGVIERAVGDLVTVRTAVGHRVDVSVEAPALFQILERATAGGRRAAAGPNSFKARLFELEMEQATVALGSLLLEGEQQGVIAVVGADHVLLHHDGNEWFVPMAAISHVRTGESF